MKIFIQLSPKTKHGKDRLHQHGEWWIVKKIQDNRVFLESQEKTFHLTKEKLTHDSRWVNLENDKDFDILDIVLARVK